MWLLVFVILTAGQASFHTKTFAHEAECREAEKNLPDPPNMAVIGTCIDLNKLLGKTV